MYLSNLKLWNFRKYGSGGFNIETPDLNVGFLPGLNVLIGENDSGKTAIVDAIKLALKTHSFDWIRVELDDFYNGASRLRVELTFTNLTRAEAKNFIDWLGWSGEGEESECFLRLILDVKKNSSGSQILPYEVRAGVDPEGSQLNAEAREYLKATYLKPLRDAESELIPKKNSRLSQILQGHEAFKNTRDDHVLTEIFKGFNTAIVKYFEAKDAQNVPIADKKGKDLKDEIDRYIKSFYDPNKESAFGVNDGTLKNILERLELSLKDVINPGLGTLNRLFMSSELLHLKKSNWDGLRLGLIEELEAHLHPQAQMQVIEALQKQEDLQLILTTHSPNLASKVRLNNLIICNGDDVFPMGDKHTKLATTEYIFLEKFLDVTKSNLFFAKGVILVEGWSEEIFIPALAKKINLDLTQKGVSIVNIGNLGFSNYTHIFLRQDEERPMTIPVSVVTDVDAPTYQKRRSESEDENNVLKREEEVVTAEVEHNLAKISDKSEKNVKFFAALPWTFEYTLLQSPALGELFKRIVREVHPSTDWDTNFEEMLATKLLYKSLNKTKVAYKLAKELDDDAQKEHPEINIDPESGTDPIRYLIDAIKHASGN